MLEPSSLAGAERKLVRDSFVALLTKTPDDQVLARLRDEGWDEIRDLDEVFAVTTLFEQAGRQLSAAPLLDLFVSPAGAGRLVLPGHKSEDASLSLSGADGWSFGASSSDWFVVDGPGWAAPSGRIAATALTVREVEGLDPDLHLVAVRMSAVGPSIDAVLATDESRATGPGTAYLRRCLAHYLVGLADAVADLVREHALIRTQFGRPLGTWQTVQHRIAEIWVDIEAARAALAAAWADPQPIASAAAKHQAASAALTAVGHGLQIFGAIGFTWEHPLHRYVRRAYVLDQLLGSRSDLASEIGITLSRTQDWSAVDVGF